MKQSNHNIIIEFDSGPIPPPFCHRFKVEIDNQANASLDLQYYDRDEISQEEIYDEGFTDHDDFAWQGNLPELWWQVVQQKVAKSNWKKNIEPYEDGSSLQVKYKDNATFALLQPTDKNQWLAFTQELIQAIFEKAKKEAPLYIGFVAETGEHADITFSFEHRSVTINLGKNKSKSMDWQEGQKLLKHIFLEDYYPEEGLEKLPKKKGNFISPGDGLWYPLSPEKYESKKEQDRLSKLIQTLQSFSSLE